MNNLLPELHEGHAPIALHQLFRDSLDLYDDWDGASEAPAIYHEGSLIPIAMVFGHMRGCTDILPQSQKALVTVQLTKPWSSEGPTDDMTVSTAARIMSLAMRKRLARSGRSEMNAFLRKMERRQSHRVTRDA
ncbi:hypothetical protein [Rhizobium sp. CC-YZS058]|uniref:hypothetical protein n=1 Tax=Rhizobium sp. CC-YZS058 TaxID=3042153 RepID=UPI002B06209D|nr:hypothetical protein [Rhizobium sp. CC-YZS058]MEA3536954.1 hypothetical protein [Rhizobium sp. CC-YZS058]